MQLIDPNHSFYRPLWIRLAIVAVCFGWAIVEVTTGEPFWAILVGALGVYSAYKLLLTFTPQAPEVPTAPGAATEEPAVTDRDPE
jgi:hypothetical protein